MTVQPNTQRATKSLASGSRRGDSKNINPFMPNFRFYTIKSATAAEILRTFKTHKTVSQIQKELKNLGISVYSKPGEIVYAVEKT